MDQKLVKNLLRYDSDTGHFYWLERPLSMFSDVKMRLRNCNAWNTKFAGVRAGYVSGGGYRYIMHMGKLHKEHRLAWLYVYGNFPVGSVDHIDGNRMNNRISNLRLANNSQNSINSVVVRGASGCRGIHWVAHAGKWRARIKINGRQVHIGYYSTKEAAAAAYADKVEEVFGEFSPFTKAKGYAPQP